LRCSVAQTVRSQVAVNNVLLFSLYQSITEYVKVFVRATMQCVNDCLSALELIRNTLQNKQPTARISNTPQY